MIFPNFIGGSYRSQSPNASGERLINLMVEPMESQGASTPVCLYPCPGFDLLNDMTITNPYTGDGLVTTVGHGLFETLGRVFTQNSDTLYEIAGGTFMKMALGSGLAQNANPTTWASSGQASQQLLFTTGQEAYVLDLVSNAVSAVEDGATFAGYMDGFGLLLDAATATFKISDSLDLSTWDPTQIVQRSTSGDPWVAMLVAPWSEIILFGSKSSDFYYNAGVAPFPFQQNPGVSMQYGIVAPFSAQNLSNAVYFLGQSEDGAGIVFELSGHSPKRVSTFATEFAWQNYATMDDAYGTTYQQNGHGFYVLTFPSATDDRPGVGRSWCFDSVTREWHERLSWSSGAWGPWRPQAHVYGFGQHLTLNREDGALGRLSLSSHVETNGDFIRQIRRSGPLVNGLKRVTYPGFQLHVQTGVGLTGQTTQPKDPITLYDAIGAQTADVSGPLTQVTGPLATGATAMSVSIAEAPFGPIAYSGTAHTWVFTIAPQHQGGDGFGTIMADDDHFGDGFYLFDAGGGSHVQMFAADDLAGTNATVLTLGTTYECAVTLDGVDGIFYINGLADGTFTSSHLASEIRLALSRFFRNTAGEQLIATLIANVAVFDSVLTPTQIADLYALRTATTDAYANAIVSLGATHYWPMDDPTTESAFANVTLRVSRDGGHTFGNDMVRSLGAIGEYGHRVRWFPLGQARSAVFECEVSQCAPFRLLGAYLSPDPVEGSS